MFQTHWLRDSLLTFTLCFAVSGCLFGVYMTPIGRPYPAKPLNCVLAFDFEDRKSAMELSLFYDPVGHLTLYHMPAVFRWTDALRDKVRPEACKLGGDLVAFQGLTPGGPGDFEYPAGDFTVYRKKSP